MEEEKIYHVKTNGEGNIIAGEMNEDGAFVTQTVVTDEAMAAVRDHLLIMTSREKKDIAYAWQYENGKTLLLKLEEKDSSEITKEEELPEEVSEETQEDVAEETADKTIE